MHISNRPIKRWHGWLVAIIAMAALSFVVATTYAGSTKLQLASGRAANRSVSAAPAGPRGPITLTCASGRTGHVGPAGPAGPQGPVGVNCASGPNG